MATTYYAEIQKLYVAYFNRPADAAGLAYWEGIVEAAEGDTTAVSAAFAAEAEYKTTYAGMTNAQIVDKVYQNLFGRAAEADGKAYWADLLDNNKITIDNVVKQIADGALTTDLEAYNNKVLAAEAFTAALDSQVEKDGYSGEAANKLAKAFMSSVTTDASLEAAIAPANLSASIAKVVAAGTAFSLTFGLQALEAATEAKAEFLEAAYDDDAEDADPVVTEAAINAAVVTKVNAVDGLVVGEYAAEPALRSTLLANQQALNAATLANAQTAVTTANANIAKVAGLSQAVAELDAAKAAVKSATTVETAASADLAAKVASYNVYHDDIVVAGDGTVAGLIVYDATAKTLKLVTGVTETTNAGITAVLAASIALEAANKAVTSATTAQGKAQVAVDQLDLHADAKALLPGIAAAMTQVEIADGATPTVAQINAELAMLKAIMDSAAAVAAAEPANAEKAAASTEATADYTNFKTKYDAFFAADAGNPLVEALATATGNVTTAENAIKALTKAVTEMNEAVILDSQLDAVNGALKAAQDAFADHDLMLPVTLDGAKVATAGADIFVAGKVDATITNFGLLGSDSLFIGSDFTLNTGTKLSAGNNGVLEVFFFENLAGDAQIVFEKSVFGSNAAAPEVVTITLTGVDAADLVLNNGIITLA